MDDEDAWQPGIAAVTLFTEDLETSKAFYEDRLGIEIAFEDSESVVFRFAHTLVNVLDASAATELIAPASVGGPDAGPRFQFTLTVDDVDAVCARLSARGVELINGPMDRSWGVRTACFADPAGHLWELASPIGDG
ncbi:MAG TPA: VOC family protein [Actinomycetota bacterium]|nr:VOC family protein [Actinomycetota bacterium]